MSEGSEVLELLKPLMARARREGLWFNSNYQDMWFSPDEMQKCWDEGRFRWGPVNWELRSPQELLRQAEAGVLSAKKQLDDVKRRID